MCRHHILAVPVGPVAHDLGMRALDGGDKSPEPVDRHPVVILCGRDLAVILMEKALNSAQRVRAWRRGSS